MNRLPRGASQTGWGKVGPHFLTNSERPMRSKLKDSGTIKGGKCVWCVSGYRVCQFWEPAQIGVVPAVHLERARELAQLRIRHPLHCTRPRTRNCFKFWLAPRWTTARPDFSRSRVVYNSSKTEQKEGASTAMPRPDVWEKYIKTSFLCVASEDPKDSEDVLREKVFFKIKYLISFSAIRGQSWQGQLWPHPVQLGLKILSSET